ncbi:hypothetical protein [Francisella frigiditurris]|uniref:Putative pdpB n=1 Tax=Francisella frigiditurris TaxID=1542390 RepID=A0A1J0KV99_9GAMM|nr:hypothetical protein [Francisella frigiditurris]APC97619.1 putative pdpB [Francisella frigiditurris]
MNFIIEYPLITLLIILIFVVGLFFAIAFLKKIMSRPKKQQSISTNIIKTARKLIKRNGIKNKLSGLYIFYGDFSSAKDYFNKLNPNAKILNYNDFTYIAIDRTKTTVLVNHDNISNISKLKSKLNLQYFKLNVCFNISGHNYYEENHLKEICKIFPRQEFKTLVISFYSNESLESIDSFNQAIGKDNTFKLTKDPNIDNKAIKNLASRVLNNKDITTKKYFNIVTLNNIGKTISNIYPELKAVDKEVYLYFDLNKPNSVAIKTSISIMKSPKSIIINLISLAFASVFVINILQEFDLKQRTTFKDSQEASNQDLTSLSEKFKDKVDDNILLSSIYPKNIKYHYINQQYADIALTRIITKHFNETTDLSTITAYLIFFEYMDNNYINSNTENIIKVISSITSMSKEQLMAVIQYTSPSVKQEVINNVLQRVDKLYDSGQIQIDPRSKDYLSTKGFNIEYLGISDTQRTKFINQIYTRYLYRCTIDSIIPEMSKNFVLPTVVSNVFSTYQENYNVSSKSLCNSTFIDSMTKNISIVFEESESSEKFTSFNSMLKSIIHIVSSLEKNSANVKSENKQASHKITVSLINYVLNNIVNSTYNNQEIPLTDPVEKELYMRFAPNFYNKEISISPIYSKEYVRDNIITLNKKFDQLLTDLKDNYNINPDFIASIYKNSVHHYEKNYIQAYNNIIDNLNADDNSEQQVNNKETLNLYLSVMTSKDSSFNNLIKFYHDNTDLIPDKEDIKAGKSSKKDKDGKETIYSKLTDYFKDKNKENKFPLYSNIDKYFKNNNTYLNSKAYEDYKQIFSQLGGLIKEQGYTKTYEEINKGYKPLEKVYSELSSINNTDNNNLYRLLKTHLDVAVKAIKKVTINDAITNLDNTISLEYDFINDQFPLNYGSNKIISSETLTKQLDSYGYIYTQMKTYLEPLLTYNKDTDQWDSIDLTSPKQRGYVEKFNKVYKLNKILWDEKGNPKPIDFKLTPISNEANDYTFFSLILDKESFVNSLNIDYSNGIKLPYKWNSNEPTTLIIKLKNGSTIQKSYTGNWSILKAIKDAKCNDQNVCTWTLQHKGTNYSISFKIESELLNALNWQEKEIS